MAENDKPFLTRDARVNVCRKAGLEQAGERTQLSKR
jgi:hypothetical protein